jgi:regulator of sirC expression with transglutaminase-like and TPR domain
MASVMTLDYLKLEAAKGNRSDFDRFMNLVPNAPVAEGDELPSN